MATILRTPTALLPPARRSSTCLEIPRALPVLRLGQRPQRLHKLKLAARPREPLRFRAHLPLAAYGEATQTGAAEETTAEIMQMFQRKVHPETSSTISGHKKHAKSVRYDVVQADVPGGDGSVAGAGGEAMLTSAKGFKKDGALGCFKCQSDPPPMPPAPGSTCGSDSNGNREYWIKTDADYLVLEL